MLKLSDFNYTLPKELIAQYPLKMRDACRLLVINRKDGEIEHRGFLDLLDYLNKEDPMVLNDTKVLPCRLRGHRLTGGNVEVILTNQKRGSTFRALIKPSRIKMGEKILFDSGKITGIKNAENEISFNVKTDALYNLGLMPLPPYIKRKPTKLDNTYYQTVYANKVGAIAAPTAGLHFTKELIQKIKSKGISIAYLTLHVGEATFKPVKTDNIRDHKMEPEYFKIPEQTIRLIDKMRLANGKILAVGTTTLRALETYSLGMKEGYTDLFIYPGYKFNCVDLLLTNFHLPRTTLYMLVCAFAGSSLIKKAYRQAIREKYRFYSYGDAMLII